LVKGDGRVRGEDAQQRLVVVGEAAAAALVGQVDRAEDGPATEDGAVEDGCAEEADELGMRGGPAPETRVGADVVEPLRPRLVQHHAQHAVLARQGTDRLPLLVAHPVDDELRERALVVGHAQRRVLRVEQLPRRADDALQHLLDREMGGDGEHRAGQRVQRLAGHLGGPGHGRTLPPHGGERIGRLP